MLKIWQGRLEKRWVATESGGDETRDETCSPGSPENETGDKTATTAGDERTAATGGVMYMDEGELEFDEDEMTALEGQHLVAEFRCGIY